MMKNRLARPFRRATASKRALPDFLIIGAQRAGTTSLFDYVVGHPDIRAPDMKEVHYFDLNYERGENWYRSHFPTKRKEGESWITGEATPYYLFEPRAAARAAELVPDAKIIVLLRNPVDRAYSQFQHETKRGKESLTFEEALAREPERLAGQEARLIAEPTYQSEEHMVHSYLARGHYAGQLKRWFAKFPRDQFLVLESETLFANPQKPFAEVLRFIGVRSWKPDTFPALNAIKYAPISKELRARLQKEFAASNRELETLLGRRFTWS